MLSFDEARALLLKNVTPLADEWVTVASAHGRVLREAVVAKAALPPFAYSAMDGYALASVDVPGSGPWTLEVRGESRTGRPAPALTPGFACAISTGAEIPIGADVVIPREQTEASSNGLTIRGPAKSGQHIRNAGEDLAIGNLALEAGSRLGPAHLGFLSSLDVVDVRVGERPRVTVLCTGDELRAPGSAHVPGKIPESISLALEALAKLAGATVRVQPSVGDERDATERAIAAGLADTDLLVTVGGVSVGEHDWVRPALVAEGIELEFWKVAIKPGKPIAFGRHPTGSPLTLGLPGNPASALITFALFGMPLVRALQGDRAPLPLPVRLPLGGAFRHKAGRLEFARVRLVIESGNTVAVPFENQASGALSTLAWADALAVIPAEVEALAPGAVVDVFRSQDF